MNGDVTMSWAIYKSPNKKPVRNIYSFWFLDDDAVVRQITIDTTNYILNFKISKKSIPKSEASINLLIEKGYVQKMDSNSKAYRLLDYTNNRDKFLATLISESEDLICLIESTIAHDIFTRQNTPPKPFLRRGTTLDTQPPLLTQYMASLSTDQFISEVTIYQHTDFKVEATGEEISNHPKSILKKRF